MPPEHTFELTNSPHYISPLLNLKGVAKGEEAVGGRRKLNPLKIHHAFHHRSHCAELQRQQRERRTGLRSGKLAVHFHQVRVFLRLISRCFWRSKQDTYSSQNRNSNHSLHFPPSPFLHMGEELSHLIHHERKLGPLRTCQSNFPHTV